MIDILQKLVFEIMVRNVRPKEFVLGELTWMEVKCSEWYAQNVRASLGEDRTVLGLPVVIDKDNPYAIGVR